MSDENKKILNDLNDKKDIEFIYPFHDDDKNYESNNKKKEEASNEDLNIQSKPEEDSFQKSSLDEEYERRLYNKSRSFIYAGFSLRFIAFLIDCFLASNIKSIIFYIFSIDPLTRLGAAFSTIIVLLYFSISSYLTKGQSIGKIIMGLKVIYEKDDFNLLDIIFREVVARFLLLNFPTNLFSLLIFFNDKKKSITDYLAKSVVVKEKEYEYVLSKEGVSSI